MYVHCSYVAQHSSRHRLRHSPRVSWRRPWPDAFSQRAAQPARHCRYEPSFFVPLVSPFSRGPSGFLPARVAVVSSRYRFDGVNTKTRRRRDIPLTYVLAANAGVVAAAVAAAVARPTKRRRVASDMSTESVAAIIAANKAPRIMPTPASDWLMTEWDQCNFAAEAAASLDASGSLLPGRCVPLDHTCVR